MKIVTIIQARIGSTRLARKAMLDIEGKPMLWHVVERLKKCPSLDQIIVATTTNTEDIEIAQYCEKENIACFRGDCQDVLDRYYRAAQQYEADVVVRITSDCPLIDPEVVEKTIQAFWHHDNVSAASNVIDRTYPRGLDCEVVSFELLGKLWEKTVEKKYREHVTLYLYEHEKEYPMQSVCHSQDFSHYRWTVDEQSDLDFVREIYQKLYATKKIFLMKDVLEIIEQNKYLKNINTNVQQKIY